MLSYVRRFDCPQFWPSLVPDLVGALKAPQPLVQHRSMLIFHHVVKALASKRLVGDRRTFQVRSKRVCTFEEFTLVFRTVSNEMFSNVGGYIMFCSLIFKKKSKVPF